MAPAISAIAAFLVYAWMTRKIRRRRKILAEPFPAEWEAVLQREVVFFRTLDPVTGELPEDAFAGFLPPEDEALLEGLRRALGDAVTLSLGQLPESPEHEVLVSVAWRNRQNRTDISNSQIDRH